MFITDNSSSVFKIAGECENGEDIIKEIIKETFLPNVQLYAPAQLKKKIDPSYITMKIHNTRVKEKITKSSRETNEITS